MSVSNNPYPSTENFLFLGSSADSPVEFGVDPDFWVAFNVADAETGEILRVVLYPSTSLYAQTVTGYNTGGDPLDNMVGGNQILPVEIRGGLRVQGRIYAGALPVDTPLSFAFRDGSFHSSDDFFTHDTE